MGNSAKAYDKKTAAFAGFVIQNIPADLTDEVMDGWMNNPAALKRFLSGLSPGISTDQDFSVVATTRLRAVDGKLTKNCFTGSLYAYRDSDFDNWLPASQPKADDCIISTLGFEKDWTFVEVAAKVLGIDIVTSVKLMGQALIKNGRTMTLSQAEEMVEKTERGGRTGMCTDGYGNFFFVETGNEDDPVSVGSVHRDGRAWRVNVHRLGYGFRCHAVTRLLVRNLQDTSKL